MYHIALQQFPRNLNRFNLDGRQIGSILVPWAQKEMVEINGQSWDPTAATITVLEGPEIPIHRLSLGRGWPLAEKQGEDVTARVIAEARAAVSDGSAHRAPAAPDSASPATLDPAAPAELQPAAPSGPLERAEGHSSTALAEGDALSAGVELAGLLGPDAPRLLAAWRSVYGRTAGLTPSESLAVAERELGGS